MVSTDRLLAKVMYDGSPQTYGTYIQLKNLLVDTNGGLTTVNHQEFADFQDRQFSRQKVLSLLKNRGIEITTINGNIVEKTGLMALAGTLKEIDAGTIAEGSKVLCCLIGGMSDADGRTLPEYRINHLDSEIEDCIKAVFR